MQIGFSINEMLFLATLVTGAAWIVWRFKLRRLGAEPARSLVGALRRRAVHRRGADVHLPCRGGRLAARAFELDGADAARGRLPLVNHFATARACRSPTRPSRRASRSAATWVVFRFPPDVLAVLRQAPDRPARRRGELRQRRGCASAMRRRRRSCSSDGSGAGVPPGSRPVAAARHRRPRARHQDQPPLCRGSMPIGALAEHCARSAPAPGAARCRRAST